MRRAARAGMALALAAALGGCDLDMGVGSIPFCIDGCSGGSGGTYDYVVGFPTNRVDRTAADSTGAYLGRVRIGETFSLYSVQAGAPGSPVPSDTSRVLSWAVTDSSVAGITTGAEGEGIFVARAPGITHVVTTSSDGHRWGSGSGLWSCERSRCTRIRHIEVTQ